jgi:hypothetical protein
MKKLFVASHTGIDGIEKWLVVRAIDVSDKEQLTKVKNDIKTAFSFLVPDVAKYDREHDVNYGPFTDVYDLSEAAYSAIMRNYPDGDVRPGRWLDALSDMGITNECDAHYFAMNEEV